MEPIGPDIVKLISRLFTSAPEQEKVTRRLQEVFVSRPDDTARLVCSVLRVSCGPYDLAHFSGMGSLEQFESAIALLETDWRDLLMAAGFGEDTKAHERWMRATLNE